MKKIEKKKQDSWKEKNKKEKIKKVIEYILSFTFLIIVLFFIVRLLVSGKWSTSEFYRDPKSITIIYTLYMMLQIVIIKLFTLMPYYKSGRKLGRIELPKWLVHSGLTIWFSVGLGVITRFVTNSFLVRFIVIAVNVCILGLIFFNYEHHPLEQLKRKEQEEVKKQIREQFYFNLLLVFIDIWLTVFLVEASFSHETIANFESSIRNG